MPYYVVHYTEHLRDGHEEGARIVNTLEQALALIEKMANDGPFGGNCTFRLFGLGKEVPLVEKTERRAKVVEYEERRSFTAGVWINHSKDRK